LATGVPASGVRSTRSLHEHTNAIELAWKHITIVAHPRVRTSPEVGPGATVGTPGLGYPLLLCLGKGLEVIFNYIQAAGPLWSKSCSPDNSPDPFHHWGRSGVATCPGRSRRSSASSWGSGPPEESRTPREVPDPS